MKYIIAAILFYFIYQYLKPKLPGSGIHKKNSAGSNKESSMPIREEDIRDAEFHDIDDNSGE